MKKLNVKRDSLLAFVISAITFALFFLGLFWWSEWLQMKDSKKSEKKIIFEVPINSNETDLGSSNITK